MSRESDSIEAHRKAQWLAYQQHLAEVEELRALERACEQAVQEVRAMQAQLLDARFDRQHAELVWNTYHLVERTELLDSFRSHLRAVIHDITDPRHIIRKIGEELKVSPCESIDWTLFDDGFRSTYPEFQTNLTAQYPGLTGTEIKVCELLKLNLITADIGTLLCVSVRSVEGHRRSIRTKMRLMRGEDLHMILSAI